jgi:hypothetical protein
MDYVILPSKFARCSSAVAKSVQYGGPKNLALISTTELTYFIIIVSWLGEYEGRNAIITMNRVVLVNYNLR